MEYKDFENALKRLEKIVAELEKGEVPLEKAMQLFEEGVKISQFCSAKLDEAERKVEILTAGRDGKLREVPYEESEGEESVGDTTSRS